MPTWLVVFLAEFWLNLCKMAPYLLFGFFAAGLLSLFVSPRLVERHLGGRGFLPVLKAAALGVPLPLCSCGVIPVSASLRQHGASRGSVIAFLIATPQTGVDSIFATYSLLGIVFAIYRPIAALISGLFGGWLVDLWDSKSPATSAEVAPADERNHCSSDGCADDTAEHSESRPNGPRPNFMVRMLHYGFVALPQDIGKSLLVGLLLAAAIAAVVPKDYFASYLGGGMLAMLAMMALGIPMYVCATASVPVALVLMNAGISPGAAMVFLMAGPATNAATIAVIWRTLGRRSVFIYLLSIMVTSLAAGLTLDYVLQVAALPRHYHQHSEQLMWWEAGSAIALLGVLGWAMLAKPLLQRRRRRALVEQGHGQQERPMQRQELKIEGMTCSHCVSSVERALRGCRGVQEVKVTLKPGLASISGQYLDLDGLRKAVREAGYQVK